MIQCTLKTSFTWHRLRSRSAVAADIDRSDQRDRDEAVASSSTAHLPGAYAASTPLRGAVARDDPSAALRGRQMLRRLIVAFAQARSTRCMLR